MCIRDRRGLYVVTPDLPDTDRLAGVVRDAIAGGGVLVQYLSLIHISEPTRPY